MLVRPARLNALVMLAVSAQPVGVVERVNVVPWGHFVKTAGVAGAVVA